MVHENVPRRQSRPVALHGLLDSSRLRRAGAGHRGGRDPFVRALRLAAAAAGAPAVRRRRTRPVRRARRIRPGRPPGGRRQRPLAVLRRARRPRARQRRVAATLDRRILAPRLCLAGDEPDLPGCEHGDLDPVGRLVPRDRPSAAGGGGGLDRRRARRRRRPRLDLRAEAADPPRDPPQHPPDRNLSLARSGFRRAAGRRGLRRRRGRRRHRRPHRRGAARRRRAEGLRRRSPCRGGRLLPHVPAQGAPPGPALPLSLRRRAA